jgi:hypothetical protein
MTAGIPERAQRGCDECGITDADPRHTTAVMTNGGLTEKTRHMDCCAAAGCPDGSCPDILARSRDARGADLTSYLTALRVAGGA